MTKSVNRGIALGMTAFMVLMGLSCWAPPSQADTQNFTNNSDYYYWNNNFNGPREIMSPIYVNVGLSITRVDVQFTVWTNMGANDASDVTIYLRHPDGTEQQLVWANTYSGQSISTTFYDIFRFNGKLSTGQWWLRVRDEENVGNWNQIGGYIDTWTLTIHYQEPSVTVLTPSAAGQVIQGNYDVKASVAGAGIDHMQVLVDNDFVSEMELSGSNYLYTLDTTRYLDGPHTISVTSIDWQGRTDTKTVPVQFDNVLPELNFTQMVNNAVVKGRQQFLVAGSNGEAAMKVVLSLTGPATQITTPMQPLGNGFFVYDWETAAFADGDYTLLASTADSAGNLASAGPYDLTVDNTPPVLVIASPDPGSYASGTITLDLTGTTDANTNSTQYRIDGGPWMPAAPSWATTYQIDTNSLSDGSHRISVRAIDAAGWSTEGYIDMTVSNANPALSLVSPSDGDMLQGAVTARARAAAFLPISEVTLTMDGIARPAGFSSASGYYELPIDTSQLIDGQHQLAASARDASGKEVAVDGISFKVDNHAPFLGVDSPVMDQIASGEVPIRVRAGDPFLDTVVWWLDQRPSSPLEADGNNWTGNISTVDLPEGPHTASFQATDLIGHATMAEVTILVDNSVPGVELVSPAGGDYLSGKALFQVKAWDEREVTSLVLHISGGQPNRTLSLDTVTGYYEFELDTTALSDGNYSYWADVTDTTGRMSSASPVAFHIDNTPPALELTYPPNGIRILGTDGPQDVVASASDIFLAKVEYSLDGGPGAPLTAPFTAGLSDGRHSITVKALDIAGHSVQLSTGFIYDATAPTLFVVRPTPDLRLAGRLDVAVSASDSMGIAKVTAAPDTLTGGKAMEMAFDPSTGLYEAGFDTALWLGGDRTVTLNVTATDSSGYTASASLTVVVDNSPPVITKLLPSASADGTMEFRFAVSDSSQVTSVLFRRDGGDWKELTFKDSRGGFYYSLWKTSLADNGIHVYEVKAVDALGNERTMSYTVNIDNKDYSWAIAAGIIILIIILVAIVLLSRWRRHSEPERIESPPESPTPTVPPAGLQEQAPPMEQRPTSLMDMPPMPPAREGPSAPPSGWVVDGGVRTAPSPPPPQAPLAEPPKPSPSELDKLVNDLTK